MFARHEIAASLADEDLQAQLELTLHTPEGQRATLRCLDALHAQGVDVGSVRWMMVRAEATETRAAHEGLLLLDAKDHSRQLVFLPTLVA